MNKVPVKEYNLQTTLLGGQAFNFDFEDGYYIGFTSKKVIKLKQEDEILFWQTYPENDDFDFLKNYLRLGVNYSNILGKIKKDKFIKQAMKANPNLRLLKQDFEQTLLSFLVSSNKNIKSIRIIIRTLCRKLGKKIKINDRQVYLFPETERVANAKLEDLLECKLGYRAKFLKSAALHLLETRLKDEIYDLDEAIARNKIIKINGVGNKIADCVLVFSLSFDNIMPLDIWGKRCLTNFYKIDTKTSYEKMSLWAKNYFNGYASWAGQFLYEYIRRLGSQWL